jgi:hypothetical protein
MKKIISGLAIVALASSALIGCGLQTAEPEDVSVIGSQGPKGDPGVDGKDGKNGADGVNGKDGKNAMGGSGGSAGAAGAAGSAGAGGSAGAAGSGGSAGAAGAAGSAGSGGSAGAAGAAGSGGCAGSAGSAGAAGECHCDPCCGAAGAAGSGGGSGPYDTSCGTEYPLVTQPAYSPAAWKLSLSGQYLPDGVTSVQLVGEIPGYTWSSGISAVKQDGRWVATIPTGTNAGTYNVSYKSGASWADYGAVEERVACMAPEAKSWLWCDTKTVDGEVHLNGCGLRIKIATDGSVTAAGNTGDWGE